MRRPTIFVVLAGLAAMVAAMVVYSALKRREAQVEQAMARSVNIVVAARDLPIGTRLNASSVKSVHWSRDSLPPGAITDPAAVIDQYTRTNFVENEPIVADRLFSGDKNAGVLPLLIPSGMRAMSVPVDDVSDIAGFVLPHTRVDVLVSLSENDRSVSKIVLQNVEVLAIAQDIEKVNDQPEPVKVVTVLVTPEEAERLALAGREGTLRLAMRNYEDKQIVNTSGVDLAQMMGSGAAPPPLPVIGPQRPAPVPRPRQQPVEVEILRDGKTTESLSFVRTGDGGSMRQAGSQPSGPPHALSPHASAAPNDSHPDASGSDLPDAGPSAPDRSGTAPPLGMLSAPPGPNAVTAPAVDGDSATPAAVLLPASSSASLPEGLATAPSGFDGPKSHTIDVP